MQFVESLVRHFLEDLMPAIFLLTSPVNQYGVVMFRLLDARVSRIARQVTAMGMDDETIGIRVRMACALSPIGKEWCQLCDMVAFRRAAAESKRGGARVPIAAPESSFVIAEVISRRHTAHRCGADLRIVR